MSLVSRSGLIFLAIVTIGILGCDSGTKIVPVSGTVKFSDGTVPTGEIAIVQFYPSAHEEGKLGLKAASGDIKPDGSFKLTTSNPGDGAFEGDYQVTFTVVRKYGTQDHLLDKKYTRPATTPHTAKVARGEKNFFEFVVEKPAG